MAKETLLTGKPWKGILRFMFPVFIGAKHTVVISEIISICILPVVFIFDVPIITAFGLGPEAAGYCTSHVRCVAICLIPFASYFPLLIYN